jgi:hypothetical protein
MAARTLSPLLNGDPVEAEDEPTVRAVVIAAVLLFLLISTFYFYTFSPSTSCHILFQLSLSSTFFSTRTSIFSFYSTFFFLLPSFSSTVSIYL